MGFEESGQGQAAHSGHDQVLKNDRGGQFGGSPDGHAGVAAVVEDDVILRIGTVYAPRQSTFRNELKAHADKSLKILVLREGKELEVEAEVNSDGLLEVLPGYALDLPRTALPMISRRAETGGEDTAGVPTVANGLNIMAGTRLVSHSSVSGVPFYDRYGCRCIRGRVVGII